MKRSLDPLTAEALECAEAALARRDARFHSVRACLRWAFRASANLQEPLPDLVRRAARGQDVTSRVDGGGGSSIEDVLCDLATVMQALTMLAHVDGGAIKVRLLRMAYQEGMSQAEMEKMTGHRQQWISTEIDRAEWFIAPALMGCGLVANVKKTTRTALAG